MGFVFSDFTATNNLDFIDIYGAVSINTRQFDTDSIDIYSDKRLQLTFRPTQVSLVKRAFTISD